MELNPYAAGGLFGQFKIMKKEKMNEALAYYYYCLTIYLFMCLFIYLFCLYLFIHLFIYSFLHSFIHVLIFILWERAVSLLSFFRNEKIS